MGTGVGSPPGHALGSESPAASLPPELLRLPPPSSCRGPGRGPQPCRPLDPVGLLPEGRAGADMIRRFQALDPGCQSNCLFFRFLFLFRNNVKHTEKLQE